MTANALCSLSLEPRLVLVCFENEARTLPLVRDAGRFGISVLTSEQEELAGVFASKLPEHDKLDGVAHRIEHGVPLIEGALAWAACKLVEVGAHPLLNSGFEVAFAFHKKRGFRVNRRQWLHDMKQMQTRS